MNDYKKQVIQDIREWASEGNADGLTIDELRDRLNDPSWSDSITGNASGSYYCNTWKAQEQIQNSGLLFDEVFLSYLEDMGTKMADGSKCLGWLKFNSILPTLSVLARKKPKNL